MKNILWVITGISVVAGAGILIHKSRQKSVDVLGADFINRVIQFKIFGGTYTYKVGTPGGSGISSGKYTFEIEEQPGGGNKVYLVFTLRKKGELVYRTTYSNLI